MKGIENIENKIIEDAKAQAELILKEAENKALEISNKAEEECQSELKKAKDASNLRLKEEVERAKRGAKLESRKILLSEKQKMIDKAYATALDRLLKLNDAEYTDMLCNMAVSAAKENGAGELVFNEKDKARVGDAVLKKASEKSGIKLTMADDAVNICGGFILRMGNAEINCSLDAIMREEAEKSARSTVEILFA